MDENLERLARDAAADPADEAAARRLDAALARAGREEELRERFRFKFQCERQWADLAPTRGSGAKFCDECQRKVFAVQDVGELREHVSKGDCVAVPSSLLERAFSELPGDRRLHSGHATDAPCVVPGGEIPSDIPESLRSFMRREVAQAIGFVPIAIRGQKLVLASATLDPKQLRAFAASFGSREVETVLVTPVEFAALIEALPQQPPMLLGRVAPRE